MDADETIQKALDEIKKHIRTIEFVIEHERLHRMHQDAINALRNS